MRASGLLRAAKCRRRSGTSDPLSAPARHKLRGGNWDGYADNTSRELLLAGAAGTGKTLSNLLRVYDLVRRHPGARVAIVRKTRVSLTESALVTWERDVLGPGHPVLRKGGDRGYRRQYAFANGSVVVPGGIDKPDKILSTEWDAICVPEATDLTLNDWETLTSRLRGGAGVREWIAGDCNPTTPSHWLYKRCQAGRTALYPTTHYDNPRYWDRHAQAWTPEGERYVVGTLGAMTGARRKRFLEGLWQAAEGLVYDGYDPGTHLHPAGWTPPPGWDRVWAIDWGFRNPTAFQEWALDGDGRMHLSVEWYKSGVRVEEFAAWVAGELSAGRLKRPRAAVCDHDPECQMTFQTHSGVPLSLADKADRHRGIQATQGRFDIAGDGRPRIYLTAGALAHPPDPALLARGRPTCLAEELAAYAWKPESRGQDRDEPQDFDDHASDACRYAVMAIDGLANAFVPQTAEPGGRVMDELPADTYA